MAQATDAADADLKKERFREGLAALESSGALAKRENTTRIMAVAWAIVAAYEIGDDALQKKYVREMELATSYVRPVGGRAPLFFCPLTKKLVGFEQLRSNISTYIKGKVKAEAA